MTMFSCVSLTPTTDHDVRIALPRHAADFHVIARTMWHLTRQCGSGEACFQVALRWQQAADSEMTEGAAVGSTRRMCGGFSSCIDARSASLSLPDCFSHLVDDLPFWEPFIAGIVHDAAFPQLGFIETWYLCANRFEVCVRRRRLRIHAGMSAHEFQTARAHVWVDTLAGTLHH